MKVAFLRAVHSLYIEYTPKLKSQLCKPVPMIGIEAAGLRKKMGSKFSTLADFAGSALKDVLGAILNTVDAAPSTTMASITMSPPPMRRRSRSPRLSRPPDSTMWPTGSVLAGGDEQCHSYLGGCQNWGPFLGPYYNTAPNI